MQSFWVRDDANSAHCWVPKPQSGFQTRTWAFSKRSTSFWVIPTSNIPHPSLEVTGMPYVWPYFCSLTPPPRQPLNAPAEQESIVRQWLLIITWENRVPVPVGQEPRMPWCLLLADGDYLCVTVRTRFSLFSVWLTVWMVPGNDRRLGFIGSLKWVASSQNGQEAYTHYYI